MPAGSIPCGFLLGWMPQRAILSEDRLPLQDAHKVEQRSDRHRAIVCRAQQGEEERHVPVEQLAVAVTVGLVLPCIEARHTGEQMEYLRTMIVFFVVGGGTRDDD